MSKKILISAIEVSADMHAANLVKAIKKLRPDIDFSGLGSEALRETGCNIYLDLTSKSTVGLIEPLKHLSSFLKALKLLKKMMLKEKPDAFFCIDGQGFHLLAAQIAKKLGIPVIYYIAPQEWLWGTLEGGKKVASLCDLIIAIFPEEKIFYEKLGVRTVYNGHPLTAIAKPTLSKNDFIKKYSLPTDKPLLALFPGSRKQEIKMILPVLTSTAQLLSSVCNSFIVAANAFYKKEIEKQVARLNIPVILKENYNAMAAADFILSSTGTITLEAALIGTPILAVYKLSPLSYWILKKSFGPRLPKYKALPNMIAGGEIMPEVIQEGVEPENLATLIKNYLNTPGKLNKIRDNFAILQKRLNCSQILENNAKDFVEFLN
jgi:lipid-A-disaccharide synthase